jgi:hydrophobe/amphiphile efflux-1 (HAE1) family protein
MARFFINRPVFAIVTALVIVLAGAIAGLNLPVAQYPQITLPTIRVEANYPGANAPVAEESVAQPIEAQVNGVDGMLYMESISSGNGKYQLDVTFGLDRNPDIASVQVQNRVSQANAQLPPDVLNAGITTKKSTPDTLMYVALYSPKGTFDELFLTNYANIYVVETLKRLKGVGNVQAFGSEFGMRVWLKPDRMAQLNLTTSDVANAIKEQNLQAPSGQIGQFPAPQEQQFQYSVLVRGRLVEPSEFEKIIVRANADGSFVRVRDVARVELAAKDYTFVSRYNGRPAAALAINLTPEASAVETAGLINAALEDMAKRFPADLAYGVVVDNTIFIKESLDEVVHTLFEALVLVLVVVLLFLQSWRATLIPMLAVPVSLIGTLAVFAAMGFTINTLTLFGMVLAIGIVVDDAIVVVEAVEHHMHQGLSPRDATLKAMSEVSGPVVAIALVLSAVFVPVAFLGGISGAMYKQFAITVAVSTLLSAFVALSLTPALCATLMKPKREGAARGPIARFFAAFNSGFDRLIGRYGRGVRTAIRRIALSLALLGAFIAGAGALMRSVPGEFVPPEDQGYFLGLVLLPEAASMNRTLASLEKVEKSLMETPGVSRVLAVSGYNILTGSPQSNAGLFVAALEPWHERRAPGKDLRTIILSVFKNALDQPEAQVLAFNPPPIPGLGSTGGFSLKLEDRSNGTPEALYQAAEGFLAAAKKRPEIGMIYSKFNPNTPAYRLEVDREKVKKLGIAVNDVSSALQTYLGGLQVNDFSRFGRTYKVTMQAEPAYRGDIKSIGLFYVRSNTGEMIPLSTLVRPEPVDSPITLQRYNLFRTADIGGTAAPGYSSGQALAALEEVAQETLPPGYAYEWSGLSRQEKESAGRTPIVFTLALVFVFLFLAALYESWAVPFAVLFAVPLGVLGAMAGLKATGLTNNIYAQIGLVLLIGLAAKNAILIVEFAKMRREQGADAVEAAIEAAKLRLRPILMTSFAFILGVVPLVISRGAGAHARVSMGITVFCGMLAATLLAIFLVPVLFVAVDRVVGAWRARRASADLNPQIQGSAT